MFGFFSKLIFSAFLLLSSGALRLPLEHRGASAISPTVTVNQTNANSYYGLTYVGSIYTVTVHIQGAPYHVALGTGSSDLWVDATLPGIVNTGYNYSSTYADGSPVAGPIVLGNVSLGGYTVEGQALVSSVASNYTVHGIIDGSLGLGPSNYSLIHRILGNTSYDGTPFMNNVFDYGSDQDPYFTVLLARPDFVDSPGGNFTISELVDEYAAISEAPKVPVVADSWLTFLDGIYVNGEFLTGHSGGLNGTPWIAPNANQTFAVVDTGTTTTGAPPYYVDAMYGGVPGAKFVAEFGGYELPCTTKLNISMKFGEAIYPIDPLDAIMPRIASDGSVYCVGSIVYNPKSSGTDFLLGDTFLRNIYALFHYGNWTNKAEYGPYMQFLSITDSNKAWGQFEGLNTLRIMDFKSQVSQISAPISSASSRVVPSIAVSSSLAISSTNIPSTASAASREAALTSPSGVITSNVPLATSSLDPTTHSRSTTLYLPIASSETAENFPESVTHEDPAPTGIRANRMTSLRRPHFTARPEEEPEEHEELLSALVSTTSSPVVDTSQLARNAYIIIGLVIMTLLVLVAIVAKLVLDGRIPRYHAVRNMEYPPAPFNDQPYQPNEDSRVPYNDRARRH
ncbi:acid protease [Sparassis crispa]|uniref:Acid protease n=1 Tax=Sparassis crispa TaxID=139825 RepID=A0A401GN00_9APHY|nr:acid protease [Sparassis crispa]GBE83572.1 acid protease [Sparassis crispa]